VRRRRQGERAGRQQGNSRSFSRVGGGLRRLHVGCNSCACGGQPQHYYWRLRRAGAGACGCSGGGFAVEAAAGVCGAGCGRGGR
jgi:hypothetical protein